MPSLADNSFASSNSSLERYETPPSDLVAQTTNTVEAAMNLIGHQHQFNQLFNFVNHIDQIELEPFQSQKIIIAFLPDLVNVLTPLEFPTEKSEETHDYTTVNGTLFFVCFKDLSKSCQEEKGKGGSDQAAASPDFQVRSNSLC